MGRGACRQSRYLYILYIPFTHPIANVPCSVDLNMRIMRYLYNVIILVQRFGRVFSGFSAVVS